MVPAAAELESLATLCDAPVAVWRHDAPGRVVAVGDVHGDLDALRRALRTSGVTDAAGHWIAGNATLVQTGDVLDRGDDEKEIYQLFDALEDEAEKAGGRLVLLNGNHELMNAAGDFRFVTAGGYADFADPELEGQGSTLGRRRAWTPGGLWARRIAHQPVVAVVGDTVFAHGGVHREHVPHIDRFNRRSHCWLLGQGPTPDEILSGRRSPVWTRAYAESNAPCDELDEVLGGLGVNRLVMGHTVQRSGIRSQCDERAWLIDVGMASHYGGTPSALIIEDGRARPAR